MAVEFNGGVVVGASTRQTVGAVSAWSVVDTISKQHFRSFRKISRMEITRELLVEVVPSILRVLRYCCLDVTAAEFIVAG